MKKYSYICLILAIIISIPAITNSQSSLENESGNSIVTPVSTIKAGNASSSIREKIRTDIQNRVQNVKINQEVRKNIIDEKRDIASSSRTEIKDVRTEARNDIKVASSSMIRKEIRQEMRQDVFSIEKLRIAKQLELAIQNLKQVRNRIDSRIKKEQQNGRDMSNAIKSLAIADAKILSATEALKTFKDYSPKPIITASSTAQTLSSSTQAIKLDTARQIASSVQKSIKDAQKSLNDVVLAIAHSMGLKLGNKEQNPTATSNTNPNATSTEL